MNPAMMGLARLFVVGALATPSLSALRPVGMEWAKGGAATGGHEAVAVIVNSANTCPDPTFEEIRAILTLERQFWKDGKRIVLILPPGGSAEKQLLLSRIYRQTDVELRRTWARRLYSGEIPAVPTSLRSSDALVGAVQHSGAAIAVVPISSVAPSGVRVLAISGKRPGEAGYPLVANGS